MQGESAQAGAARREFNRWQWESLFLLLPMVSLLLVGLSMVAYVVFLDAFGAAMESLVVFVIVVVFVAASLYHRARGVRGGRSP